MKPCLKKKSKLGKERKTMPASVMGDFQGIATVVLERVSKMFCVTLKIHSIWISVLHGVEQKKGGWLPTPLPLPSSTAELESKVLEFMASLAAVLVMRPNSNQ